MKKLLLTIGSAASIVAPLSMVVACEKLSDNIQVTYDDLTTILTVSHIEIEDSYDEDDFEEMATAIKDAALLNEEYGNATSIVLKGEFSDEAFEKKIDINAVRDNTNNSTPFITLVDVLQHTYAEESGWSGMAVLGLRLFTATENIPEDTPA